MRVSGDASGSSVDNALGWRREAWEEVNTMAKEMNGAGTQRLAGKEGVT